MSGYHTIANPLPEQKAMKSTTILDADVDDFPDSTWVPIDMGLVEGKDV